jgi:hypothetical protein
VNDGPHLQDAAVCRLLIINISLIYQKDNQEYPAKWLSEVGE